MYNKCIYMVAVATTCMEIHVCISGSKSDLIQCLKYSNRTAKCKYDPKYCDIGTDVNISIVAMCNN